MPESFKPTKSVWASARAARVFHVFSPKKRVFFGEKPLVLKQGFKESQLLGLAKKGLKEFKTAFEPLDYPDGAVI